MVHKYTRKGFLYRKKGICFNGDIYVGFVNLFKIPLTKYSHNFQWYNCKQGLCSAAFLMRLEKDPPKRKAVSRSCLFVCMPQP